MKVYPVFLNDLAARRCVVIGGGHEAARKVQGLLDCDASVTVISADPCEQVRQWAVAGRITWLARAYRPGDLRDTFLVIVSEIDPEATEPVWQEAQREKVLINAMDDVPHCTFVAGSTVRRGALVVSISTSGCAPALAVRLRQRLEASLGPEHARLLDLMRSLRAPMAARYPDFEERRRRWYALVDSDLQDLLGAGDFEAAHRRVEEIAGEDVARAASL